MLFRLVNERKCGNPVLLLSGISSTSEVYIVNNASLGYLLSNRGHDVWLGNFRGNLKYSDHVKYSKSDSEFWDFSWEEMADYDLPSMIDHILQTNTNKTKLTLVTISLSTLISMSMQATKVEYNDKISRNIAMAPVIHIKYTTSVAATLAYTIYNKTIHFYDTFGKTMPTYLISKLIFYGVAFSCLSFATGLCRTVGHFILGYSPLFDNWDNPGWMATSITNGASFRTYLNLAQSLKNERLARYDFGREENLRRYGTISPPVYDWSRITTPTSIFYGANDALANPLGTEMASRYVKSSTKVLMEGAMFNHVDFAIYTDQNQLKRVNDKILEHIQLNSSICN